MEKFFPGSDCYAEMVALLHQRYPAARYGREVVDEIEEIAINTSRWAYEICTQYRELRTMIVRFPSSQRRGRSVYDFLQDAIGFSSLQNARKHILVNELKKLKRNARTRGPQEPSDLLAELFLRYHSRLLAQELHLRVSEPLLRSVDQVLKAEIMAPPY